MNIGSLEITFQDNQTNTLNLTNMYPVTDSVYIEETSTNQEFKTNEKYSIINRRITDNLYS